MPVIWEQLRTFTKYISDIPVHYQFGESRNIGESRIIVQDYWILNWVHSATSLDSRGSIKKCLSPLPSIFGSSADVEKGL